MTPTDTTPELTPRQRAEITRKANKAKRDEARRIAEEQYKKDKVRVIHAMRRILDNDDTTPAQTVFAAEVLDHLLGGVGLIPWRAQKAIDGEPVDLTAFARAVDAVAATREPDT